MGQYVLNYVVQKGVQSIGQNKSWKTESASKADSAVHGWEPKAESALSSGKSHLSSRKSRLDFPGVGAKADSAFSSVMTVGLFPVFFE